MSKQKTTIENTAASSAAIPEGATLLSHYVQQASVTGTEQTAGRFFANLCAAKGLKVRIFSDEPGKFNFAASLYPLDIRKPNLLFLNHIDVVEPGDEKDWKYPPFSGTIAEGFVWGRGAYDNKGSAIVQLTSLAEFVPLAAREDLPFNVSLVSVSGEETFNEDGAEFVAENFMDELNPIAVIGEGPVGVQGVIPGKPEELMFGISVANKRVLWLKLSIAIKTSGHGSTPPKAYANKVLVQALNRLTRARRPVQFNELSISKIKTIGRLAGGWRGALMQQIRYLNKLAGPIIRQNPLMNALFSDTFTISHIQSQGNAHNAIAQKASALLDCRLLHETSTESFLSFLKNTLKDDRIKIECVKETPGAAPDDTDHPVYRKLAAAIGSYYPTATVFPMMLPNTSDCNTFRSRGVPVFSSVPVRLDKAIIDCIHAPNERMPIQALKDGKAVFVKFLNSIFENNADDTI